MKIALSGTPGVGKTTISLLLKKTIRVKTEEQLENLNIIVNKIKVKCPSCGLEFNSTPLYCYKCNSKILVDTERNVGIK